MANGNFGGGNGTLLTPYLIEDGHDFYNIRLHSDKHFKLNNSINLSDITILPSTGWVPMPRLTGSIDGQGYIISGLYLNNTLDSMSLINVLEGQIYNLQIINANLKPNGLSSILVNTLIGSNSRIENCIVTGTITPKVATSPNASLVYNIQGGVIENCGVEVNITTSGIVGGICNNSNYSVGLYSTPPTIRNCYYIGNNGTNASSGGILGTKPSPCNIENCFYNATKSNANGISKTLDEMKLAITYTGWTDKFNSLHPIWTIVDGSKPILYYNIEDLFLIKANESYYTIKNNEIVKVSDLPPTKDQFISNGISGPELSSIPGKLWNEFRQYMNIKVISMSDKNMITKNRDVVAMTLEGQTVDGFLYKSTLDVSLYGDKLGKIYFDRRG